jgi:hypothetical protein
MDHRLTIPSEYAETIDVFLSETAMPVAFDRKVRCLMNSGLSRREARQAVRATPLTLEIFYDIDRGMFALESEAIESIDVYNPYTGEIVPKEDDDNE